MKISSKKREKQSLNTSTVFLNLDHNIQIPSEDLKLRGDQFLILNQEIKSKYENYIKLLNNLEKMKKDLETKEKNLELEKKKYQEKIEVSFNH